MPNNATWYVLADGKQVRILARDGHAITQVQQFDSQGRGDTAHDTDASVSHIHAPGSDPHVQAKEHFARHIAKHLNSASAAGDMKHFHLAAPAHVLHDIIEHLDKPSHAALLSKQSKDLTHIAANDVMAHFSAD